MKADNGVTFTGRMMSAGGFLGIKMDFSGIWGSEPTSESKAIRVDERLAKANPSGCYCEQFGCQKKHSQIPIQKSLIHIRFAVFN